MSAKCGSDVPVLIAGGGLIGLSAAMFLAQHGVPSLVVERLRGGSPLPRAAFFHMRTIEMFRTAGIEDEVREQSDKEFVPEGAIVLMDTLAGKQLADIIPSLNEASTRSVRAGACSSPSRVSSRSCAGAPKWPARRCSTGTRWSASSRTRTASP